MQKCMVSINWVIDFQASILKDIWDNINFTWKGKVVVWTKLFRKDFIHLMQYKKVPSTEDIQAEKEA